MGFSAFTFSVLSETKLHASFLPVPVFNLDGRDRIKLREADLICLEKIYQFKEATITITLGL